MPPPALELADIFRLHGPAYRQAHELPWQQHRLMQAIEDCRTPALCGVVEWCDHCQYTHIQYRSCRNRHCPKCQGLARARWLQQRQSELLPVEYFHVVFTVPELIAQIAFYNKKALYEILFHTAAQTLLTIARDPKRLGVEMGFFSVLHTWGQNLHFHPHLHCVVPGGGLSPHGRRWISGPSRFLLPVRVLSALFRRLFLQALEKAYAHGKLRFFGDLETLRHPQAFARSLAPLKIGKWVVYAKAPFGGPQHVLKYLGRYTHRVAISNRRLLRMEAGQVSFQWKDYRDRQQPDKVMTVAGEEFIRRFLQHALPPGFQRIRYYGFLANCHRKIKLDLCRQLLAAPCSQLLPGPSDYRDFHAALTGADSRRCPLCGQGCLSRFLVLPSWQHPSPFLDSSRCASFYVGYHRGLALPARHRTGVPAILKRPLRYRSAARILPAQAGSPRLGCRDTPRATKFPAPNLFFERSLDARPCLMSKQNPLNTRLSAAV